MLHQPPGLVLKLSQVRIQVRLSLAIQHRASIPEPAQCLQAPVFGLAFPDASEVLHFPGRLLQALAHLTQGRAFHFPGQSFQPSGQLLRLGLEHALAGSFGCLALPLGALQHPAAMVLIDLLLPARQFPQLPVGFVHLPA